MLLVHLPGDRNVGSALVARRFDDRAVFTVLGLLLVVRCRPRPGPGAAGPRLDVRQDPRIGAFVAVHPSRVKAPFLAWLALPFGPQPVHVGVQQEDEGILERRVGAADVATDLAVRGVVRVFDRLTDRGPLLGLG